MENLLNKIATTGFIGQMHFLSPPEKQQLKHVM